MPDSSISPSSFAGDRTLRNRLLPSWVVRYFSRGRISSSAPIASFAIASSGPAPGDDDDPPDGPRPHSHSSSSTAVASPSASPSQSSAERAILRHRLSLSSMMSRLSRAFASSGRGSPPAPVSSPSPEYVSDYASDALQVPPSPSADSTNGRGPEPLTGVLSPPRAVEASETTASAAGLSNCNVPTASIDVPAAASDDSMTEMWTEAVADWQRKTGLDLTVPDAIPLRSKAAVMSYMEKMEKEESDCEKGEWETLRERVDPLARILEKLCNPIGDTISAAFPPSNIVFAAVGLIVSAYTRTREDFAQIGDAFNEMRFHLQVVETVADSHPGSLLRDSCVHLLTQVLAVLGVITEMRREGCLRRWLGTIMSQVRPLSEALQNLRLLANKQQQAIAGVTLANVTELMENIAADKVTRDWMCRCLVDVLRATRNIHDLGLSTHAEAVAHRAVLRRVDLVLYNQLTKLRRIEMFAEYEQIKGWLNYVDPSYRLRKLLDDRAEGTGSWFLDGNEFAALKEGKTKAILLSGKAGSGKSTIIAASVEALRAHCAGDPRSLVLVHVFDSTNSSSSQRNLHSLLSTLICQLALNDAHCASIISKSRKAIVANGLPTKARMEELFLETLRATSLHAIVVVDALDEADDEDEIISFLQRLEAVSAISVIASRRPFTDSTHSLGSVVAMDNHGENNDIGLLLDIAMSQGGDLAKVQLNRDGVRERLLAGAEGNFRWVALVIQELKSVAGIPTKVLRRLESLPISLQALYQQCLNSIRDDDRDDVRRLLLWLVRSEVPLRLNDFADLMAFDYSHETPIYHASHRPLPEAVISMVGSMLITVDGGIVRLAHASVRDFLLGLAPESPFFICKDTDYALMARTVLAYISAIDQVSSLDPNSPLTYTWAWYVQKAGSKFYNDLSKEVAPVVSKVAAHPIGAAVLDHSLLVAALIGHHQLVAALIDDGGVEVECADVRGQTPLHLAAWKGHLGVAILLLDRGAAVTARAAIQFTPLMMAARHAREDVARLLLDQGAHIEDCNENGWTSLHLAAQEGHLGIVTLLLAHGASVGARTKDQSTPLTMAAERGREELVRLLLNKGARVGDFNKAGWSALHLAAKAGHLSTARLALEYGASVSARTNRQSTPLIIAVQCGREDVIRLLLERGACVEDCDVEGWVPLHFAAEKGHAGTARLLLRRGALVSARTMKHLTPLTIAAFYGQEDIVRLLLDQGADIEANDVNGCTPLHYSVQEGHLGISHLLLDHGASISARNIWQSTPLIMAVTCGREDVVRLLLESGACVEETDEDSWDSLHLAAHKGYVGIVTLLLEHGASVSARTKWRDTPLMKAVHEGQEDVARLLLDWGADIAECEEVGWTSLHMAARQGFLGVTTLLLERGAPISARNKDHLTPLMLSAGKGRDDIVSVLLDRGAHIEESDHWGQNSLNWAAWFGQLGTARVLLERGANIDTFDDFGQGPVHCAAQGGHIEIIKFFVQHGAATEVRDKKGRTPLYLAVRYSQESATELLLSLGGDPRTRADDGTTLLDAVGQGPPLSEDAERDGRIRDLLMQAGCTEETESTPLGDGLLPKEVGE